MQIVDRLTNGVGAVSLTGTTHTLTTTNGTLSDGQYGLIVFGGSPSGANTVTIAPNDAEKIYFIRNTTAQSVVMTQGSGGDVTVPAGTGAIIYADGTGTGATVTDLTATFIPDLSRAGITASAAELNILAGVTASTAELNILAGVTASTAELNILAGVTATTADLNILDGVTATAAELNLLAGATLVVADVDATAAELNLLAGATLVVADVDATAAELNILGGVTATTAEINYLVDVTSAIQDQIDAKLAASAAPVGDIVGTTDTQVLTNKTTTNLVLDGSVTEEVFAVTGTTPELSAANGTIQTWTLAANSTPTEALTPGQSLTLMVDDGTAYTITWPTMKWVGGTEPTLAATDYSVITLWKVGSTIYGSYAGDVS